MLLNCFLWVYLFSHCSQPWCPCPATRRLCSRPSNVEDLNYANTHTTGESTKSAKTFTGFSHFTKSSLNSSTLLQLKPLPYIYEFKLSPRWSQGIYWTSRWWSEITKKWEKSLTDSRTGFPSTPVDITRQPFWDVSWKRLIQAEMHKGTPPDTYIWTEIISRRRGKMMLEQVFN